MNSYRQITGLFQQHLEALSLSADGLAEAIEVIAAAIVQTSFSEKKVFVVGLGSDGISAQSLIHSLETGLERERPSLPCIGISDLQDGSRGSAIQWACNRLRALGQPDDIAVVFGRQLTDDDRELLAKVATQRDMSTFWVPHEGNNKTMTVTASQAQQQMTALTIGYLVDVLAFGPISEEA
ncbi:MAG: hypothetical protein L7S45_04895 [Luminiphilus sp.]|nr:hypothetical protein [Luminiphilus sp.]